MESQQPAKSKPLRQTVNFGRDLANAYKETENSKKKEDIKEKEDTGNMDINIVDDNANRDLRTSEANEIEEDNTIEIHLPHSFRKEKKEKEELLAKIEVLETEKAELKEMLMNKAAELENFRKRTIREKQDLIDYANEKLLLQMLVLLDDMQNALIAAEANTDYDALHKGLELIDQKTKKLFEDAGVIEIENPVGKPFDVNFHDAMMVMDSEFPEGTVVQEVLKGFMIHDKVLRHSRVITSTGKKPE